MSTPLEMEYLKLWMEQSKLFWSRLQTVALLHSGVLAGWYQMGPNHPRLRMSILGIGFLVSIFLWAIMVRDVQYLDALKAKAGALHFPYTGTGHPKGRHCGYVIVAILMATDVFLAFHHCILGLLQMLPKP